MKKDRQRIKRRLLHILIPSLFLAAILATEYVARLRTAAVISRESATDSEKPLSEERRSPKESFSPEESLEDGEASSEKTTAASERQAGFRAGIAEIWQISAETEAALEALDGQLLMQAVEVKDQEEDDEYSNLAIADVDHYVNVRSNPDTVSEVVGKMYDGSVAQILAVINQGDGEWFQVVSGSVEGYIKAEFFIYGDAAVRVIDDYVTRYAQVKADRLNVRKEPDIEADRIGYMSGGEKARLLEYGEEWSRISYADDKEGYVASEYISLEEEFIYAKSIEEERAEAEARKQQEERQKQSEQEAPEDTTVIMAPPPTNYTTNAELRSAIVQYALQYVGMPYVHGGKSLATGTDCSGFTSFIYAEFGYGLSRTPQGQWGSNGRSISVEEIQPGDIVCYSQGGSKCTHVGIYIGNGQIVHAANPRKGTVVSDIYYGNKFIGVKNVID